MKLIALAALALLLPGPANAECTPAEQVVASIAAAPSLKLVTLSASEHKTAIEMLHAYVKGLPETANFVLMVEHSSGSGIFLIGENHTICGRLVIEDPETWAKLKRGILSQGV
jgi:hypothetical protein